jgi:hypothetical protein
MKKLLTIIFILSLTSSAMAWPWDKKFEFKDSITMLKCTRISL